jgi:hypothetical protein
VAVNVLETFLEAILCTPFQLCCCILNDVGIKKKSAVPSVLISVEKIVKNQVKPGQVSNGEVPGLLHTSLLRHSCPQLTGVPERCREVEINCCFYIFRDVSF